MLDLRVVVGRVEAVLGEFRLGLRRRRATPVTPHDLVAFPADGHVERAEAALGAVCLGELYLSGLGCGP